MSWLDVHGRLLSTRVGRFSVTSQQPTVDLIWMAHRSSRTMLQCACQTRTCNFCRAAQMRQLSFTQEQEDAILKYVVPYQDPISSSQL